MNERCGNLYENKGPAFRSLGKSGNVRENKGGYALKAGMLVKTNRIQDSGVRSQNEKYLLTAYCLLPTAVAGGKTIL